MRRLLSYWYSFIRQKPSTGVAPIWRTAFNRGQKGSRGKDYQSHWHRFEWFTAGSAGAPLLGFSFVTTFRDMIGMPPFQLDKDPLKHKVKEAWLYRKYHNYDKALVVLEEAMQLAVKRNNDLIVSRIIDELANTYYEMGKLDDAERSFRDLLQRLITLHKKQDSDPEFIEVSLKLSDIFAQKGKLDDAEIGFKHCVTRQMKVVEMHMAKYSIRYGSSYDVPQVINQYGASFTDPLALYGLCLEQYAHFIVRHREEKRLDESTQLMDEALKKYLEVGIDRILYVDECSSIIPGYYCNYSEALYHCGNREEALRYAKKAADLSHSESKQLQKYTTKFLHDMERDYKRRQ